MKVELGIKTFLAQKSSDHMVSLVNSTKHLKNIIDDNIYQDLTSNGIEETDSKSFHEALMTLTKAGYK